MNGSPVNRLWVQFSLAFAAVILIAALVIAAAGLILRPDRPDEMPQNFSEAPPELREQAAEFLARGFLAIAVTGSIIGIGGGIWMARRLTAPLDELTRGAQAIGSRDLSYRVQEQGSYETISLAHTFNQMAADLEEAETMRQNLLADVAHELRTPLTVLQGNLRAILDDVYVLDKAEVARLYDQTRHLSALVNDLHELAQAEARRLPMDFTDVEVGKLAMTATDLLEPLASEQGVDLMADVPKSACMAWADRGRLMQVLQNLLTNALRHTPSGGAITVSVTSSDDLVTLTVADSGDGIAAEHLPRVFDRFYRSDAARDRDSGGAGLGLAIARAMIEAQGGEIGVASDGPNQGTTFLITLPLAGGSPPQAGRAIV